MSHKVVAVFDHPWYFVNRNFVLKKVMVVCVVNGEGLVVKGKVVMYRSTLTRCINCV